MDFEILERKDRPNLAYRHTQPSEKGKHLPYVLFCGGFKSDMSGTKAGFLEEKCKQRGQGYIRFDYSGHGESEGKFEDGTISSWKEDATDILNFINPSEVVIVGSSMGGWIALLTVLEWPGNVKAMIGIAAAPDFTKNLWSRRLNDEQREAVQKQGYIEVPNNYSPDPYVFTKALFDDAEDNLLLDKAHKINIPITLMQGMNDEDVPWETTAHIQNAFTGSEIDVVLIEDGDHSLSRPEDLDALDREVMSLSYFNESESSALP